MLCDTKRKEGMSKLPYALAVGSLMNTNICFVVGMVAKYQSNTGEVHWQEVKHILKYLKRTRNYMLIY